MKCGWCGYEGGMAVHSGKYGRSFCSRSCFSKYRFRYDTYNKPLIPWGELIRESTPEWAKDPKNVGWIWAIAIGFWVLFFLLASID